MLRDIRMQFLEWGRYPPPHSLAKWTMQDKLVWSCSSHLACITTGLCPLVTLRACEKCTAPSSRRELFLEKAVTFRQMCQVCSGISRHKHLCLLSQECMIKEMEGGKSV